MSGYTQISKILNDSTFLHTDYEVLLFIQKTLYLLASYHKDGFVHGSISNDSIEYNPITGDVRLGSIRVKYEITPALIPSPEIPNEMGKQKMQEQNLFPSYSLIPSLRPNNVDDYLVADTRNLFAVLKNIIKSHFTKIPSWLTPLIEQWDSPFGKKNGDKKPSIAALEAGISYVSQLITSNVVNPDADSNEEKMNPEDQDEIIEDDFDNNDTDDDESSYDESSSSDTSSSETSDNDKEKKNKKRAASKDNINKDTFFAKSSTIGQLSGGYKKKEHQRYMTLIGPGIACSRNTITLGNQSNNTFGDVSVQIGYKKMLRMGKDKNANDQDKNNDVRDNNTFKQEKIPPCTVRFGVVEERVLERIRREKMRIKKKGKNASNFSLKDMNRILDGLRGLVWAPTGAVNHGVLGGDLINGTINDKQYVEIKSLDGENKIPYILNRFDETISSFKGDVIANEKKGNVEDGSKGSNDIADTYNEVISKGNDVQDRIALFPHTFLASPFGTDDILTIRDSTSSSNFSSSIVKLTINGKEVGVFSMKKWLEAGYNGMRLEKDARKIMGMPRFRLIVIITTDTDSQKCESNWTCSIITQSMRNCLIATHLSLYPQLGKVTGVELPINQLRNAVGFGYRQQGGASVYETLPTRTPNIHTGYPYTQMIMTGSSSGSNQITPYSIVLNSFTNPSSAMPYDFSVRLLKKTGKILMKIRSVNTGVNSDPRSDGRRRSSERGSGRGSICFTPGQLNGDMSNQLSNLDQRRHSSLSTSSRTMFVEIRMDMSIVINIHNGTNMMGISGEENGSAQGERKRGSDVGGTSDIMLTKPTRFVCGPRKACNLQEGDIIRVRISSGGLWLGVNGIWLHYDKDSSDADNALPPGIKLDHSGIRAIILPMGVVLQVMTPEAPSPQTRTAKALLAKCQTPLVAFDPFSHTRNVEIGNTGISLRLKKVSDGSHSSIAFVDVPLKVSKRTLVPNSGVCAVFRVVQFGSMSLGSKNSGNKKPSGRYGFMVISNNDVSQFLSEADDSDIDLTSLRISHFAITSDGLMSSRWSRTNEDGSNYSKKSIVTSGASKRELEIGDIIAMFLDVKLGGVIILRNGIPIANSIINGTSSGNSKVVSDPDTLLEGKSKDKIPDAFYIDSAASYRIGVFADAKGSREGFKCELLSVFGQ